MTKPDMLSVLWLWTFFEVDSSVSESRFWVEPINVIGVKHKRRKKNSRGDLRGNIEI
jgi:hypothetical protein